MKPSKSPDAHPKTAALLPEERKKALEEENLTAGITHEVIRREAIKELHRTPLSLGISALGAGLAMGLSVLTQGVLHHALPETTWRPLVTALGYAIGFLVVTLGSQQLYTENTLMPVVPLMAERTAKMLRKVLTLWAVVLLGNLVGTAIFAIAAARTAVFSPELRRSMHTLALEAMSHDAMHVFASGIAAGFIIALMIWMLPAAQSAQVWVIVIMTWLVGAAKLSHVIVGSLDAFYLVALGDMNVGRAFGGYIFPALIGNTIGGIGFVAALNHAQVKTE
jgi:formate/nitrite transporter FocA (FNT family)